MDPRLKLKFPKHSEIKIRTFESVFIVWKCRLSPRHGIVISKLAHFEITLIVTKLSLSCLKCCTVDAWVKLMFQKALEIRIWTFLSVFCASKCRLSPRLGIYKSKLVLLGISLIVTKLSLSCLKCSSMDPLLKFKFPKYFKIRIRPFVSVFSVRTCHLSPR